MGTPRRRLILPGEVFTQAEIDDGAAVLEEIMPAPTPPPIDQDEHWPADWGAVTRDDA